MKKKGSNMEFIKESIQIAKLIFLQQEHHYTEGIDVFKNLRTRQIWSVRPKFVNVNMKYETGYYHPKTSISGVEVRTRKFKKFTSFSQSYWVFLSCHFFFWAFDSAQILKEN